MVCGVFFLTVSGIGLIRLPDFYTRNHAVGKSETLGAILVLSGFVIYNGLAISSLKLLIILMFVLLANPTATHAISKAALRTGLPPWIKMKRQKDEGRGNNDKSDKEAS